MSYVIPTYEPDKKEMYDWHHMDIINRPPYSHYDMVVALADGVFMIEGKKSDLKDAQLYADYHNGEPAVWQALDDIAAHTVELTIDGVCV